MANFDTIINSNNLVLVDFYATWCGPCQALTPVLKDVKSELGAHISIVKMDVDKNQALASQYQVRGVPTLLLFKNGKQIWRQSGVPSKNDLIQLIKHNTN
jgi:thioredoxin 1